MKPLGSDVDKKIPQNLTGIFKAVKEYFEAEGVFLIGSYARGDQGPHSDVDVLVVTNSHKAISGIKKEIEFLGDKNIVSIVRYPFDKFKAHWLEGSLFSFHIKEESILFYRNERVQNFMKNRFKLKSSFESDIDKLGKKLEIYEDTDLFDQSVIYFSSQLFLHLKNIAIFKLAEQGKIELNKWKAYEWLVESKFVCPSKEVLYERLKKSYLLIYKKVGFVEEGMQNNFGELVDFVKEVHESVRNRH